MIDNERKRKYCPICGKTLVEQWRVHEERVPSTVPVYFSRSRQAPYRITDDWEEVKCARQHWFKRRGDVLTGMDNGQTN